MRSIDKKEPPTEEEKEELIEGLVFVGLLVLVATFWIACIAEKL